MASTKAHTPVGIANACFECIWFRGWPRNGSLIQQHYGVEEWCKGRRYVTGDGSRRCRMWRCMYQHHAVCVTRHAQWGSGRKASRVGMLLLPNMTHGPQQKDWRTTDVTEAASERLQSHCRAVWVKKTTTHTAGKRGIECKCDFSDFYVTRPEST